MKGQKPQIIRGTINGKEKYCRIPIRSKLYELMQDGGELTADKILSMPHEKAITVIDAIMADWMYWMRRAGEYFVQLNIEPPDETGRDAVQTLGANEDNTEDKSEKHLDVDLSEYLDLLIDGLREKLVEEMKNHVHRDRVSDPV